ncbi:Ubiquitin carboxyl-terminal hydrolase 23 [Platanthera zijinensis]|uniref:Ubiquitin carboxyl-terminal hydrolase n=1 Tax=Platanthera zijinensis TaxID=2320716 RepID=A0AAP0AYK1_9ASPA
MEASTRARRSETGGFCEHGFDTELRFRISFQKIGAGLENLGNTCYLNSVLQCLTYTEPFAAYLHSGKHKSTCRNAGFCAMCALQKHVMVARQSTGKILRPFHLVKNLKCISRNFQNSRQEDAHEYMVNLLESMHKCCLPYGVQSESPSAYEKSQVHRIFGGKLRSQVKCDQCSYCSNKFDPFLDLSLEIMRADSLRKALAHFTAMELLDGGERQYQCQRCKEKVRAFKQLTIHKAPYVLTIHLKRFGSTIHGEKLSKKVEYGPTLDLNPFISDRHEGGYKYTLYGVLVHAGWSTQSGHYFCYVRTSSGMWYSLDDNQVTQVSEKTVLSREAYMLFYVRDRKSAVKSSVTSPPKADISARPAGNIVTPMVERKSSVAVHNSVNTNDDATLSDCIPAVGTSLPPSVNNESSLLHGKDQVETKNSCMQVDGDAFINRDEKISSKDPVESLPLIDSKLPSDGDRRSNSTNESAQGSSLVHRFDSGCPSVRDNIEKSIAQSNTMTDYIQKEAADPRIVNNQDNGQDHHEIQSFSIEPQLQNSRDSLVKLMEVDSLLPSAAVCCVQQDTPACIITDKLLYKCYKTKSKPKKILKSAKVLYFGRKKLFVMSLHLTKKHMRNKKHHLTSRNRLRIADGLNTDSHEASTSETFRAIDAASRNPPSKNSHSTNRRRSKGNEGFKFSSSSVHNKEFHTTMNSAVLEISNKSSRFHFTEEDMDARNISVNLLRSSLRETSVARWFDRNIQAEQMKEMEENSKRNVGYILDE